MLGHHSQYDLPPRPPCRQWDVNMAARRPERDGESRQFYGSRLVGRKVTVKGRRRTVVGVYADISGGIILDREIDGFVSWNVHDTRELRAEHWERRWRWDWRGRHRTHRLVTDRIRGEMCSACQVTAASTPRSLSEPCRLWRGRR